MNRNGQLTIAWATLPLKEVWVEEGPMREDSIKEDLISKPLALAIFLMKCLANLSAAEVDKQRLPTGEQTYAIIWKSRLKMPLRDLKKILKCPQMQPVIPAKARALHREQNLKLVPPVTAKARSMLVRAFSPLKEAALTAMVSVRLSKNLAKHVMAQGG